MVRNGGNVSAYCISAFAYAMSAAAALAPMSVQPGPKSHQVPIRMGLAAVLRLSDYNVAHGQQACCGETSHLHKNIFVHKSLPHIAGADEFPWADVRHI